MEITVVDAVSTWELNDALSHDDREVRRTNHGVVTQIDDDGQIWVRLAGADEDTPIAQTTVSVDAGDSVTVRIQDGRAYIDGSTSNPSASSSGLANVDGKAMQALTDAATAAQAALEAVADAATARQSATEAMASAETAQEAAEDAQESADAAQDAADAANNNLRSVVQGATTVEKAVSVMQTALEAVVDYDPQEDVVTEYFWHDANGAHVLGDTSGYRNDINSSGMDIVDVSTERSVAQFGANGARIGKEYDARATDNESNLILDYHSMKMVDRDGETYFLVSDLRDRSGYASVEDRFVGDGSTTSYQLSYYVHEVESVTVGGTERTDYTASGDMLTFSGIAPDYGAAVVIRYSTEDGSVKAYTMGSRNGDYIVGSRSFVLGTYCAASEQDAHAEGYGTYATGQQSHAEGTSTEAIGAASHAEGKSTSASGNCSHAEGEDTDATGRRSHAEGYMSEASGAVSHAEGYNATALGNYSHAEGRDTNANEEYAHAEGRETTASGKNSHAEGYKTQATATNAHAEGSGSVASGISSHAQNSYTTAAANYQTAIGKYNVADTVDASGNGAYALIVGNGTANNARSNALTVDWNGNVVAAGGLDLGTPLAIADGGTGATTAAAARANLAVPGLSTSNTFLNGNQTIKQTNVDTTEDDNGITGTVNRYWSILDKNDHYAMWIGMEANTSGRIRTSIGARNYGGGSQADNAVYLDVANDGTRSVGFSSGGKAAWLAALGLNTWTTVAIGDFATAASGWALSTNNCNVQYNATLGALRVRIQIQTSAAQTAGQKTLFTVKTAYRPKTFAASLSSLTAYAQAGQIYTTGGFAVNISAISANTSLYFNGVYFIGA